MINRSYTMTFFHKTKKERIEQIRKDIFNWLNNYICARMISFDDTETAFKSKTDAELNRAYKLFKLVGSNTLVSFGKWATNVALLLK